MKLSKALKQQEVTGKVKKSDWHQTSHLQLQKVEHGRNDIDRKFEFLCLVLNFLKRDDV